ncbi:LacI family DNA-binding transcriptional regulator [Oceanispirochaeta sp.]|uniref:LacI family DNA-binding transcriptional regulator n=1 Tax=Oceanispirochaeta sp. TaxID=2035350 RepID=UPI00262943F9|nr:LacI family DNA-binding transcriptional regulator [Oceanispirochaeta sp.]MDA3956074.1 LacI family DNA-binding transcriptional regulator [Oceanispirochaeta sp.]
MTLEVDRSISIPPYQQIVRQLRERITHEEMNEDDHIPSAREIVQITGVSLATAQRVLNELKNEGLIYSLPGKGSFISPRKEGIPEAIHIFLPSTRLSFFMEILNGVYDALSSMKIDLKLHSLNTDKLVWDWKTIEELEDVVKSRGGVIFIEEAFDSVRTACLRAARQIPFVTVEWQLDGACAIVNDYEDSTASVVSYLCSDKHCSSLLVLKGRDFQYNASLKLAGIKKGAEAAGLRENRDLFFLDTDFDAYSGYESVTAYLKDHEAPQAIFCANDYEAIGVIGALTEQGLLTGRDVQLVGYGDMTDKTTLYFPLTTVKQNLEEMGRQAVKMLLLKAKGEDVPPQKIVATELIVRKT